MCPLWVSPGSGATFMGCSQASRDDANGSVVFATVVALHEPIVASARNIFVAEASIFPAQCCRPITVQMFEVQLHQARIVEIGRKVLAGARSISAHADDGIANFRRQTIDTFRTPWIVVPYLAAASECRWLVGK